MKNIKIYNHFPCVVETGETIHLSHIQGVAGVVTGLGILLCAISAVVNPTIHKYITLYAAVFLCGLPGSAVLIGSFLLHQRLRSQVYKDDFKLYVSISSHKFFFQLKNIFFRRQINFNTIVKVNVMSNEKYNETCAFGVV